MKRLNRAIQIGLLAMSTSLTVGAAAYAADTFDQSPEKRWSFVADTVMGGESTGTLRFAKENGFTYASLTGNVSTANRGGFIQMRKDVAAKPSNNAKGVRLIVRGNGQQYFVHLRTSGTILPWQYYQGAFKTTGAWNEVRIPFSAFEASGRTMRSDLKPGSVKSIGVVAFGRNHSANIEIKEVDFY